MLANNLQSGSSSGIRGRARRRKIGRSRKYLSGIQLKVMPLVVSFASILVIQVGHSLRMINLDAPQIALQGDTIHLSCLFKLSSISNKQQQTIGQTTATTTTKPATSNSQHLSLVASGIGSSKKQPQKEVVINDDDDDVGGVSYNELLYAIKWYKDGKEFYRYLAQDWPKKQWLSVDGIQLDVDKSDNHTIVLRSVSLRTSGQYKCEVSTDAPRFITKSIERRLSVYALPNKGPTIEMKIQPKNNDNSRHQLFRNESVELTCSTPESKPALSLDWIINDTLNLSTKIQQNSNKTMGEEVVGRYFNFTSSRFVRLAARQQQQQQPILYLIHNGSLASPLASGGGGTMGQAINLSGSLLDRLAETSTTRLNFTADADLFHYLGRLAKSRGTRQTSGRTKQFKDYASHRNSTVLQDEKAKRRPLLAPKKVLARPNDATLASSVLRIKCVARVMHLMMSDEIKVNLVVDKSRDEVLKEEHESSQAIFEKVEKSRGDHLVLAYNWPVPMIAIFVLGFHELLRRLCQIRLETNISHSETILF